MEWQSRNKQGVNKMNKKKLFGLLFFTWAIGYFLAMQITVRGLPSLGLVVLIAIGGILYGKGMQEDSNNKY